MGSRIKIRLQDRRWLGRTTGKMTRTTVQTKAIANVNTARSRRSKVFAIASHSTLSFSDSSSVSFYSWGLRSHQTWHWSKLPVPSIESGCCLFRSTAWNFHSWKFRFPPGELGWCFRTSYCLLWVFPELSRLHQEADLGLVPKDLLGS